MAHRRLGTFVPPEHGAWAMLLVPFLLGTFTAEPDSQPAGTHDAGDGEQDAETENADAGSRAGVEP